MHDLIARNQLVNRQFVTLPTSIFKSPFALGKTLTASITIQAIDLVGWLGNAADHAGGNVEIRHVVMLFDFVDVMRDDAGTLSLLRFFIIIPM